MPEQALLPGFESPSPATDRLLFLTYPNAFALGPISGLARRCRDDFGLWGRPLQTDIFHVTLVHLGDFAGLPADIVGRAFQAADTVQAAPFEVSFDRVMSFSRGTGKRPLVLHSGEDIAPLMAFQQGLLGALLRASVVRAQPSKFKPHVTLLYDRLGIEDQVVDTIRWTIREFVLVHSLLGETRHVVLGRWRLV